MEAKASASHDKIRWGDAALPSLSDRASRMKKWSMRAVVAAADAVATAPATPSPKVPLTASLASAPPVNGNPPRLKASAAATISAGDRPRPGSAATTPTVRNSAAFTST